MTDKNNDFGNERIQSLADNLGRAFDSRRSFLKKGAAVSAAGLGLSAGTVAADDNETNTTGNETATTTPSDGQSGNQQFVDALNFALTLERLEATFYTRGLDTFSQSEIESSETAAQLSESGRSSIYDRLQEIKSHEQAHVDALVPVITDLGGDPVGEDDVSFQFDLSSPDTFIETAQTLETTGVSAYTGAIDLLSGSDALLTTAATIATVEGRHSAYLNDLTGKSPFPEAFDQPKEPEEILEIIQPFMASTTTTQQ